MSPEEREKVEVEKARRISQILDDYKELEEKGIMPKRYTKDDVHAGIVGTALLVIGLLILYILLTVEDMGTDSLIVGFLLGGGVLFGGIRSMHTALKEK